MFIKKYRRERVFSEFEVTREKTEDVYWEKRMSFFFFFAQNNVYSTHVNFYQ